jgi:uncharacterized membrane protein
MAGKHTNTGQVIDQHAYKLLTIAALVLVVTGTVVYRWLEDWSWVDSVYFSVVAVTTVGFGDLTPTTDAAKVFTIGYLVVGVSLITTYLNLRFRYRTMVREERRSRAENDD